MPVTILTRFMQWSSAVIVMGITSYFMHNWPKGQHTIYQEVIVCIARIDNAFCMILVSNMAAVDNIGCSISARLRVSLCAKSAQQIRYPD